MQLDLISRWYEQARRELDKEKSTADNEKNIRPPRLGDVDVRRKRGPTEPKAADDAVTATPPILANKAAALQPSNAVRKPGRPAESRLWAILSSLAGSEERNGESSAQVGEDNNLPQFRFLASDVSLASTRRRESHQAQQLSALREAFTPTQPKQQAEMFAGRRHELARIVSAIEELQAHVIIYGERGFGKTSLANVVGEIARAGGITVLNVNCSSQLSFEEMFRGFLKELPMPFAGARHGSAHEGDNLASLLPPGPFGAKELTEALRHLSDIHVIFRIDEFDRVLDSNLKNQVAEVIKSLSDISVPATILIVGVAEDLDALIGTHPSIQRNVVGIHLPLMTHQEIAHLIKVGEKAAGVRFADEARGRIISLSRGLPYQAQLLCLHSGQAAVERGANVVELPDLDRALERILQVAPHSLRQAYERAIGGDEREVRRFTLLASAICRHDPYGLFTADDVRDVLTALNAPTPPMLTLQRFLAGFAKEAGGTVLNKIRTHDGIKYGFINPNMPQYVMAKCTI